MALLSSAGVASLVDVRTAPGSRRHPHVGREEMARWLPEAGIAYRWEKSLGGWRTVDPASKNTALRNESFRGYADYMGTEEFWAALDRILDDARQRRSAVMCGETVWWRCHRRLIADAALLVRGVPVCHLGHDGRLTPHRPTEGVRVDGDRLVYDVVPAPVVTVTGLDHVVLAVRDAERALEFYCGVLGLAPVRVEEWRRGEAPFPSARIDAGTIVDLFETPDESGSGGVRNLDHLCLVIERTDLAEVARSGRLEVAEGPGPRFGARGEGTSLYVRDPDGNTVELRYY